MMMHHVVGEQKRKKTSSSSWGVDGGVDQLRSLAVAQLQGSSLERRRDSGSGKGALTSLIERSHGPRHSSRDNV